MDVVAGDVRIRIKLLRCSYFRSKGETPVGRASPGRWAP